MADVIAVLVLAVLVGSASAYIVKAKKSGVKCIGCPAGGSCPGSARLPKKKLDGPVTGHYTLRIPGMHCQNCVNSVTRVINSIDGASAKVSLKKKSAEVSCDRDIDKADLIRAVESAGFEVESIS